jgi:hypothetical protein
MGPLMPRGNNHQAPQSEAICLFGLRSGSRALFGFRLRFGPIMAAARRQFTGQACKK